MVNTFIECKTQATHIYFPLRHLEWLILFTASHKLHFRASSFRHDVCPCTINLSVAAPFGWILSFCAVEKRGSWIPSSLLIEFSHEMQTSFFTLVARICEHTHKESINLSTQLAAPGTIFFYVVSLLRLVVLGLWFLTISCVVVCKIHDPIHQVAFRGLLPASRYIKCMSTFIEPGECLFLGLSTTYI